MNDHVSINCCRWLTKGVLTLVCALLLCSGCFPDKHSQEENGDLKIPHNLSFSEEENEKYLRSVDPNFEAQLKTMENKLKSELGVREEKFPSPPPGWNLDDDLGSDTTAPRIYRWLDAGGNIKITRERPPDDVKILGWRYYVAPTPSPGASPTDANTSTEALD